jgi:SNF2 family DNA or RNA helicase
VNVTLLPHGLIAVSDAYRERTAIAALTGAMWSPALKCWTVDATPSNAASLAAVCPTLPPEVRALLPRVEAREAPRDTGRWLTAATPYAHQREAVAAAMQAFESGRPGFALLLEMGCGKTLAALELAARLHRQGKVRRVLIVCPSSVVPVWSREIAQFLDRPRGAVSYAELLGTKTKRLDALSWLQEAQRICGADSIAVAIINYESAWRLGRELAAWKPDMVIADESQRIKGHASKQTKGVTALAARARYRLALSGTPVTNGPMDVFAQWRYLDPSIFGPSYYAFRATYAVMGGFEGKQVVGYKALERLTERAHSIAYRVTKADALDLPATTDVTVPVELSSAERGAYQQLARDSVAEFAAGEVSVANVLTRLLRLQQIASGSVPLDDGTVQRLGTSKADAVIEIVEDAVSGGDKVVVFARFRSEIAELVSRLPGCVELTGDTPTGERGELVRRFQEDEDVRVLVAQLQVGGAGITLHAASTMVFASLDFNYASYEQAKARIHRIGQTRPCTYYHVLATGTVDEQIAEALRLKRNVADLIVNRGARIFAAHFSTWTRLLDDIAAYDESRKP